MKQLELLLQTEAVDSALHKLVNAPVPPKTDSYTPISHSKIITNTLETLEGYNFKVKTARYRSSADGLIGSGEYHIEYGADPEMGLMLAWQNSYNKQVTFKYAIGAHVFVCANGMVAGDLAAYKRKHTGTADEEALGYIHGYIGDAAKIFGKLIEDREMLKKHNLTLGGAAEMMGRMFICNQIITSTHLNIIKREIENPTYEYGVGPLNAWALYNYATHAFKEDSPRNWIKRHTDLHKFFRIEFGYDAPDTVPVEDPGPIEDSAGFTIEDRVVEERTTKTSTLDVLDLF